jgi:hypothetical protein
MKKFKYILLSLLLTSSLSSCSDWLDVNTDQDTVSSATAQIVNQLPWIEHFRLYGMGGTNLWTSLTSGSLYSNNGVWSQPAVTWNFTEDNFTTRSYQIWYVYSNSVLDVYSKAEAEGAYYYMGAANVIHAMGFMEMLDLYGEVPYSTAFTDDPSPAYDDGKAIFEGCIAKLDAAIELFQHAAQEPGATDFAAGDYWLKGDVANWIKLCYGLKARYLLKLSKKAEFDPAAILDCLSKSLQSNADNVIGETFNRSDDQMDWLYGDPIEANTMYSFMSYWNGSSKRPTKFFKDLLVNMRGAGVVDPRMPKIIPSLIKPNGEVLRSEGIDIYGPAERLAAGAATIQLASYASSDQVITYTITDQAKRTTFVNDISKLHACTVSGDEVTVTYQAGSLYIPGTTPEYVGDTAYVNLRSNSAAVDGSNEKDLCWYTNGARTTCSYQLRATSDFEIMTYAEACFIKAEVYMRQNNSAQALTAYKAGIQAHLDMMQERLTKWESEGYLNNPDMMPMDPADMSAYMSSPAVVQTAGDLKMSDIMLQKYIAMGYSLENWNDMRRFNYSAGNIGSYGVVYPGFNRSPRFTGDSKITGTSPTDPTYWPRRWRLPYQLELIYNTNNAVAMNKMATETNVWCEPVWWDCATDDEYYGYLR